jgi:capsular exopolysaccharide synthesis family protein
MQDTINAVEQRVHLDLYRHKNSIVNDAYDRMVAGIHLQKKNSGYSTYTITGCEPGAGTTTIAISLAISLAISGWKTVLIDTDMKKGEVNKRLNQEIQYGLSDYLSYAVPMETIFCETNFTNLKYITCGPTRDNDVEMLCSNRFDQLMSHIKENFDMAIFDSPSLNASVDAGILAAKTDTVILVAEQNVTKISQIKAAKRELDNTGANLLGIVLNHVGRDEYKHYLKNYDYFRKLAPKAENKTAAKKKA